MPATLANIPLDDSVAKHVRKDYVTLSVNDTIGQALDRMRGNTKLSKRIVYCYVTDLDGKLVGVVPTRELLLQPLDTRVRDVMHKKVVALPDSATVLDACEFFIQHHFLAFPVVDAQGRLIGKVDAELYTDEVFKLEEAQRRKDLFQLIGVHLTRAQMSSPWQSYLSRFPWLLCNVSGGIIAAFIVGQYEYELTTLVQLSLFIPVVLALSESVAIQSVSIALQSISGTTPTWKSVAGKLWREGQTGLLLGLSSALILAVVAWFYPNAMTLLICLLGGVGGGVTLAALLGLAIPNLLHLLRLNPQVAAGPVALASADIVTLVLYFSLARFLLQTT